ncbi:AraC family transcriptional regulator [Rudanella lutea]|uniref:AraC family transcriptional regulator n=1 Tax=Rudanella lutea TaxID=451374 RepID=UPI000360928A|nr:AraC family transcriptional regulator [Rudanella lutea]
MTLTIRNMVCGRCKRVVREELEKLGITVRSVELGEVDIEGLPPTVSLDAVREVLRANEFDLVDNRRQSLLEQMKALLVNEIQHAKGERRNSENFSAFLERKMGYDYSFLSHLFSANEGMTIEKYIIALKIEKVKEYLRYDELSLSEIAFRLGYSSSQHLSNQFRQVTGQTPGGYRKAAQANRKELDKLTG